MTDTERVPHPLENPETDEVSGREVAQVLGVAPGTVHRWRGQHGLRILRQEGRTLLYSRAQILGILAELEPDL
jgi:transposase-like protein